MKRKVYPYIIILILGILVEWIAFLVRPQEITVDDFLYEMFLNVGFMLLTIVIVNALWFLLGGEPLEEMIHKSVDTLKLVSDSLKGGLYRAFLSSANFKTSSEWISLLKKAKTHVDLMGYSLNILTRTREFQDTLVELANRKVKVRVMIMDNENDHFTAGLNFESINSMTLESMKDEIDTCTKYMEQVMNNVKKNKKNNIKFVKIKKGLTECQIIRIDNQIYITPYLYSKHTADSPLFIFREQANGYFEKYLEEFNTIWKQNSNGQTP